ncbi:MAG TPA: lectin-like protein [Chryseolinea sp.]|nr:lectin-like protein [Chryseolinea sp.]
MNRILICFLCICHVASFGQIAVTGSGSATTAVNNGPSSIVDASLTVVSSLTIPAFQIRISSNFSSGDLISFTAALPGGVTGSYAPGTGIYTFTGAASAASYQALLQSVTFSTTSSSALARTISFEAGDGTLVYNAANGHFYKYVSGTYTWAVAKADAATKSFFGMQGYLTTITSSAENTFVMGLAGRGWLGASDEFSEINISTGTSTFANQAASEGKWYWVTGPERGTLFSNGSTVVTYASWNSGEPNNSGSNENFADNTASGGSWNDIINTNTISYLLEFGGVSTEPAVDFYHTRTINMIATQLQSTTGTSYQLHDVAMTVDPNMTVFSAGTITDGKATISSNFSSGDVLSYSGSLPSGVTVVGSGYIAASGVLSFSGTTSPANWQALFRTVKFNSSSNVIGDRTVTFSVGNKVAFTNGHFYESVATTADWTTSKSSSAGRTYLGLQGYLATVTSTTENDFIKQKLGTDAWIGLSDSYSEINIATGVTTYANQVAAEGKWYWVTGPEKGTQVTTANAPNSSSVGVPVGGVFNNWNTGEPNNSSTNENYGEIYAASSPGKWNDLNIASLQYVVEYGGLPTDPLVYLSSNTIVFNNSVVPVTGLDFNAEKTERVIQLKWSTQMEFNCDHFDILHGTDGTTFNKIAELPGHGNSNVKQYYKWTDRNAAKGKNFYRLQQFDIDGESTYSPVRQVYFEPAQTYLSPNPATNQITIIYEGNKPGGLINIYSVSGIIMFSSTLKDYANRIDIHTFPPGFYLAVISDSERKTQMMFIKR